MAAKNGLFQKSDQKKQYSDKVLNNVEDAYRPKNRGRVRNPISSNTMSGEDPDALEAVIEQNEGDLAKQQRQRFKKPVAYAFAGPQAKRQKQENPEVLEATIENAAPETKTAPEPAAVVEKLPPAQFQARKGKTARRKTGSATRARRPEQSRKLSETEIQVFTGHLPKKLSEPEIQIRTEDIPAFDVMEAMRALEADVQESKGNYEPIEECEFIFKWPAKNEIQYELDLDSLNAEEFSQSPKPAPHHAPVENADSIAEPISQDSSAAGLGLIFEPQDYRRDLKKTQVLSMPRQGVKRSNRGTIEAVFPPNGKVVEAQYNRCGILIEVSVAGAMKLTRSAATGQWTMSYGDGSQPVSRVTNVAFDRQGNLCYSTEDGHTTVICADGSIVEK